MRCLPLLCVAICCSAALGAEPLRTVKDVEKRYNTLLETGVSREDAAKTVQEEIQAGWQAKTVNALIEDLRLVSVASDHRYIPVVAVNGPFYWDLHKYIVRVLEGNVGYSKLSLVEKAKVLSRIKATRMWSNAGCNKYFYVVVVRELDANPSFQRMPILDKCSYLKRIIAVGAWVRDGYNTGWARYCHDLIVSGLEQSAIYRKATLLQKCQMMKALKDTGVWVCRFYDTGWGTYADCQIVSEFKRKGKPRGASSERIKAYLAQLYATGVWEKSRYEKFLATVGK